MSQRDFGWLVSLPRPVLAPQELMAHVKDEHDAILLTWNLRTIKRSMSDAAALLEMPKSHLSNILAGKKYLPHDLRIPFMWLCGNLAVRQWEDAEFSRLNLDIELLEAEQRLEEIKARTAA
jgi:DNA invertase Pin-like site-specific DNA recombinase